MSRQRRPGTETGSIGSLGDFRTIRVIGRGGMGVVYEAVQISLNRRVALKILPMTSAGDPRKLKRFQIEAQAAALLNDPHIVPVYVVGSENGIHFYAMQLIEGQTLAELISDLASHVKARCRRRRGLTRPGHQPASPPNWAARLPWRSIMPTNKESFIAISNRPTS